MDDRRGSFGGRGSFGPREMHKAVCSDCGQETEVPFKPIEGRPVYCRDCYQKHKTPRAGGGRFGGGGGRREMNDSEGAGEE